MSDLKNQLLKLGLVSDQQARRVGHEQRVQHKAQGREGIEADKATRIQEVEQARQGRRDEDRSRERARQAEQEARALQHRIADLVESGRAEGRTGGSRRFYYEARDGRVPVLELSDEAHEALGNGRLALAESARGEVTLITADAARRVGEVPEARAWLRVWNGR